MNEKQISCSIKLPVSLTVGAKSSPHFSGCKIIEVTFPGIINPEVGSIHFKNNYVAFITVKAKVKHMELASRETSQEHGWRMVIKHLKLMPDPHAETGAQDTFSLTRKHMNGGVTFPVAPTVIVNLGFVLSPRQEMANYLVQCAKNVRYLKFQCEMTNIASLRIILQQPSPQWKDFKLDELLLFKSGSGMQPASMPAMSLEYVGEKMDKRELEGGPSLDALSRGLQQMWALAEEVAANQTQQSNGRYDVDGCYDINLLSYS